VLTVIGVVGPGSGAAMAMDFNLFGSDRSNTQVAPLGLTPNCLRIYSNLSSAHREPIAC